MVERRRILRRLVHVVQEQLDAYLNAVDRAAWSETLRRARSDKLERSIKAFAKSFAQNTTKGVDDRRLRQQSRTFTYNELVPILRCLSERQITLQKVNRYLFALITGSAGLGLIAIVTVLI